MLTKSETQILQEELERINQRMQKAERQYSELLSHIHPANRRNAINLLHYLVLRNLDIRDMQDRLHAAGLSSLASAESHIRGQLISILQRLGKQVLIPEHVFTYERSKKSLEQHAAALFGKRLPEQLPFMMVTLDAEMANDYPAIKNLLQSGMNVARINCAHDDESAWFRMIQHVRRASRITGSACKIYMDLAGPKIRTVLPYRQKMKLTEGQLVYLTDEQHLKKKSTDTIGCTIKGIARQLQVGDTVLFDDGLIEARVERLAGTRAALLIMRISSKKPYLKNEKGINFPDSRLKVSALTEYDKKCLPFMLKHADMIGYSYVRQSSDLDELRAALGTHKRPALVIKVETPESVKNLPSLLFNGMREEVVGVMIARGDLAVEIGFERMSEIQEEIMWICEAAHVPVIWATQVLENLNKSGVATRSEITDAAHAAQADCVMINKGQHIIRVMETLRDIFVRIGGHHIKKRYTFRPLAIAVRFLTHPE